MAGEKTEKATHKRKQDERKKGNVFQSKEVVVVVSLVATFYGLKYLSPIILGSIEHSIEQFLELSVTMPVMGVREATNIFYQFCMTFALSALPMLLICSAVTVVISIAQTRGLFAMKAASPKFNRLNPIEGFKRLFSLRGVIELVKSLLKITVLGYIIYNTFKKEFWTLPSLFDLSFEQAMAFTGEMVLSIAKTAAIVMLFVAGFDYLYQWWDYEKNLRMSKQEIKEEYKQTEGDPQIKGKIRQRQQEQARQRMMQQVPQADVVIRNPTHFAVAIKYDPEKNNAPIVIAKGMDSLALRIVHIAEQNDVVITENKPLARGLYEAVDLDREIPGEFYQPVAEVLAFVYSLKKKELK